MQQRQLRLGDILDDYCPRERRVTNHAIVAIVGQEVRQTRCVTCEAEHEYKQARIPPQRKKKPVSGALYQDVLSGMPTPTRVVAQPPTDVAVADDEEPLIEPEAEAPLDVQTESTTPTGTEENEGPAHRPLIRATLPRPEGQVPGRPIPDFTVRQPNARAGRFRPNGSRRGGGHASGPAGPVFGSNGRRGAAPGGRPAQGNRARPAQPDRQGGPRRRGGKKRMK
jgi:hypothetical protein